MIGIASAIDFGVGLLGGSSSTPAAEKNVDQWTALILADLKNANVRGTATHAAWVDLRCGAGDPSVLAEYRALGVDPSAKACGYGRQDAIDYAKAAVATINAALTARGFVASTAGNVAVAATGIGLNTSPTQFATSVQNALGIGSVSPTVVLVGLAIAAYLIYKAIK